MALDISTCVAASDGQVQGNNAVATSSIGQCLCRRAVARCVGITIYPCVGVAMVLVIDACVAAADGQV